MKTPIKIIPRFCGFTWKKKTQPHHTAINLFQNVYREFTDIIKPCLW
jgi:hypothetical protein